MKHSQLCLAVLLLPFFSNAQDDFDPLGTTAREFLLSGEKQIRVQVEWIEVSHERLTKLMSVDRTTQPEGMISSNENRLRREVADLIETDEAKMIDTAIVIARSGNRAKVESVLEFIYPTEYDPPPVPADTKSKSAGEEENEKVKESKKIPEKDKASKPGFPLATAFDVRNLGTTLEVDPVLGADNRTIDLNLAPEIVYQTGFENYGKYTRDGDDTEVKMPKFYMVKVTTQVTAINGEYLLIGVATPKNAGTGEPEFSRKLMIFVKADILVCRLPVEKEE